MAIGEASGHIFFVFAQSSWCIGTGGEWGGAGEGARHVRLDRVLSVPDPPGNLR